MDRRTAIGLISAAFVPPALAGRRDSAVAVLQSCRQLLLVESPAWSATSGKLTLWERDHHGGTWRKNGRAIPVVLGRAGMRWGRGWHAVPRGAAVKREGDGCSPAGIFSLDFAFGSMPAHESGVSQWPWRRMTATHAGVDDPRSRHYNRIVDSAAVKRDWASAENMVPAGGVYRCGVVVRHNWDQRPGAGSCIFLHVHSRLRTPTAGCTSMSASSLRRLLKWLDTRRNPLLVQLPQAEWRMRALAWGLPQVPGPINAEKTTKNAQMGR
jgi:L,D-peptidoglycan transpeptidase YkuD (ErfK/YbiS/YcfS/YnhG family)